MGKHVIRYCDRCKKEMPHASGFLVQKYLFNRTFLGECVKDEYELCKDCTDALNGFMRNPEQKHENCNHCAHHEGATGCRLLMARDGKCLIFNDWDSCPHFEPKVVG